MGTPGVRGFDSLRSYGGESMGKEEALSKIEDWLLHITGGQEVEEIVSAMGNYFSGADLEGFVEHLQDEGLIDPEETDESEDDEEYLPADEWGHVYRKGENTPICVLPGCFACPDYPSGKEPHPVSYEKSIESDKKGRE